MSQIQNSSFISSHYSERELQTAFRDTADLSILLKHYQFDFLIQKIKNFIYNLHNSKIFYLKKSPQEKQILKSEHKLNLQFIYKIGDIYRYYNGSFQDIFFDNEFKYFHCYADSIISIIRDFIYNYHNIIEMHQMAKKFKDRSHPLFSKTNISNTQEIKICLSELICRSHLEDYLLAKYSSIRLKRI